MLYVPWTEKPSIIPHVSRGAFWIGVAVAIFILAILSLPVIFPFPHDLPY